MLETPILEPGPETDNWIYEAGWNHRNQKLKANNKQTEQQKHLFPHLQPKQD